MNPAATVLLVEDDQNDVWLIQHAWKKAEMPCPLKVVCDGQEAIEYMQGQNKFADRQVYPLPGLILLDLNLPRRKGFEVLEWLRHTPAFKNAIVIVLTSSPADRDIQEAYCRGANSYLVKPNSPAELLDLIKAIKAFWLNHNHPPALE